MIKLRIAGFVMSAPINFPDPWVTDTIDDVIAVGGELNVKNLILAYALGIFPWPHKGYPLLWFCPDQRGILDFKDLHIGRSLKKWIKKNESLIEIKINHNFHQVIKNCRLQKRPDQDGSWINLKIEKSYCELSILDKALSLECYINGELVSGIYGVMSDTYFSCESMFFKIDNGSKFAFVKLVEHLAGLGHSWMDLQMITDVSGSFGGKYISKNDFLTRIMSDDD
jgi:leucyl/phenylalanyl-tRNA---protein transferase